MCRTRLSTLKKSDRGGKNMRHFRIYANDNYLISLVRVLKERYGVECKFKADEDYVNTNKDIGDYDIYIDTNKYFYNDELISMIKDYEVIELSIREYERLVDKKCERSYNELISKYKVILEERDKYAEKMLKVQREDILKDVLNEYKGDIERRIGEEVNARYHSLFERFHKEECRIDELCLLYKKYIDAEIKKGIEEHIEKILNEENLTKVIPYISDEMCRKIISSGKKLLDKFYSRPPIYPIFDHKSGTIKYVGAYEHDAVYRDIKKFKNDLVDNFMAVSGHKRGDRDYMLFMKRAGRLADLIEGKLWEYYELSIKDKNNVNEVNID